VINTPAQTALAVAMVCARLLGLVSACVTRVMAARTAKSAIAIMAVPGDGHPQIAPHATALTVTPTWPERTALHAHSPARMVVV